MSRFIRAPREKVFDAFVTESLMAAWQCPRGMRVTKASADVRVDGEWQIQMAARDGTQMSVGGRYRELQRPQRLAYTWRWQGDFKPMAVETLIEVEFESRDGGTEMRMTHSGFPEATNRDQHQHGWGSCFNRLVDLLDERGSAATVTLLGDPRSSYTRTARMALAEKGVAYTLQRCAPHSPEVLAIHPFGRIPVFRDGDTALWETSAILRYIDESFGDTPSLTPGRIADRVACDQWVSAVNCYLYDTMVRRCLLQYLFPQGEEGRPDRAVIDKAVAEMPAQFAALERAYQRSDYLAGGGISFADLFVAPILAGVEKTPEGAQLMSDMPNIRRAQAAIRQRASFVLTDPTRA
jgi:glutathione S-transferase